MGMIQTAAIGVFLLAVLVTGVFGTETRPLFFWPGAGLLGVAGLMATLKWRLRILFPPSDVCLAVMLLFVAYVTSRAVMSPVAAYAREDLVILLGCVVSYVLTVTVASHPRWRIALIAVLLVLAVGNLAVGSVHLSGNWGFHLVPHFIRSAELGRIGGFFVNANHLAAFLSFVVFLSAGWLCFGRGGAVLKLWLGFMIVAMAVGMSLTVSRGALLGLAAGGVVFIVLALWIVWQTQRHFFWSLLGAGLVIALLAGAVLWKVNDEYLRSRIASNPMSSDVRLGIWEAAMTQHSLSPVVGAGARMFYDGGIEHRSPTLPSWTPEALFAHNEYLQMLADYGWVGLGLLVLMILVHVWNGLRFLRWFVHEKFILTGRVLSMNLALAMGALAALAATLVHAVFEFHYHVPATALGGAVLLGLLANPGFESMLHPHRRLVGARPLTKILLGVASLALLSGVWCFGRGDYALAKSRLAQAKKDPASRRLHLDAALSLDPTNPEAYFQRGIMVLDTLNGEQRLPDSQLLKTAAHDLEQAVTLNPFNYLYRLALADALDAQGQPDKALQAIQRAIQLAPLHEEPRLALGLHWHGLGQWEKAEAAYLWAARARAMNKAGTANWLSSYHMLLEQVAAQPLKK